MVNHDIFSITSISDYKYDFEFFELFSILKFEILDHFFRLTSILNSVTTKLSLIMRIEFKCISFLSLDSGQFRGKVGVTFRTHVS